MRIILTSKFTVGVLQIAQNSVKLERPDRHQSCLLLCNSTSLLAYRTQKKMLYFKMVKISNVFGFSSFLTVHHLICNYSVQLEVT